MLTPVRTAEVEVEVLVVCTAGALVLGNISVFTGVLAGVLFIGLETVRRRTKEERGREVAELRSRVSPKILPF
jgi:hypothetical protein